MLFPGQPTPTHPPHARLTVDLGTIKSALGQVSFELVINNDGTGNVNMVGIEQRIIDNGGRMPPGRDGDRIFFQSFNKKEFLELCRLMEEARMTVDRYEMQSAMGGS